MGKQLLLKKLQELYSRNLREFKDAQEIFSWADRGAALVRFSSPEYLNDFNRHAYELRLPLSIDHQTVNFNFLKQVLGIILETLKLQIEQEQTLQDEYVFPSNSQLSYQKTIAMIISQAVASLWVCDP